MTHVDLPALLAVLQAKSPVKARALSLHGQSVDYGLLSVGIKVHCLEDTGSFDELFAELGGRATVLEMNHFKGAQNKFCFVLPPVGAARHAIMQLEAVADYTGEPLFNNPNIQLQVCSPGRLDSRKAGLLTIGAYLASDVLAGYTREQLTTTFSFQSPHSNLNRFVRARRLTIYDAGVLDKKFDWWGEPSGGGRWGNWLWKQGVIQNKLPLFGRTDVMLRTSKTDIRIVNFIATLLVHHANRGYWARQGALYEEKMVEILTKHGLIGHLDASWIQVGQGSDKEEAAYIEALQEIMVYALTEAIRIKRQGGGAGILEEIYNLLNQLRSEIETESRLVIQRSRDGV